MEFFNDKMKSITFYRIWLREEHRLSTIADVARAAGVSVATVSRVINQNGPVAPETAQRVRAAIEEYDYQPNAWGRSLRRQESRMLLIFVPNISNPYYSRIVSGIEETARGNGYNTMLCITDMKRKRTDDFVNLLRSGQADGAIMLDVTRDNKALAQIAARYPVVQCCEFVEHGQMSHVSIDNFAAARQMVEYLISIGHRRIAFLGADNRFISSEKRRQGYEMALQEAGIPCRSDYIASADANYNFQSGVRAAGRLLSLQDRPTAIFCVADILAIGAIHAAQEKGIAVPEQLTVTGFDDVEYATMFTPKLTTLAQPGRLLGRTACEMLLRRINGARVEHIYLEHQIILRDSSAPCAGE